MTSEGKIISVTKQRIVLSFMLCLSLIMGSAGSSFALGLGEIRVKSSLGQNLLAHSDILGAETDVLNTSCLRARVNSIDGVFLASVNVSFYQKQNKRALSFTTKQAINEPAVTLIIDINCETQLHREFSILLDPPDATHAATLHARDESPFAGQTDSSPKLASQSESMAAPLAEKSRRKKSKESNPNVDFTAASPSAPTQTSSSKAAKKLNKPARDVLKLSDEVVMPQLPQGLKMSDVLSSEAGQQLLQNNEELRAAQARMAALLRDEMPPVGVPLSKQDDLAEIAKLKRETELLRQQSMQDKTALDDLQKKSQFDFWLILLGAVALLAIGVIVALLFYIRKNLSNPSTSWWQGSHDAQVDDDIELAISELNTDFGLKVVSGAKGNDIAEKEQKSTTQKPSFQDSTLGEVTNSGLQRTPTLEETNSSIFNFFSPRGSSVKVEEISDVTQEAEFWISMNDPLRAIEILQPQERIEHPDSPLPWLFLLDLYRTVNDAVRYNQLRDRFIVYFNANIPEYDADLSILQFRNLEDFEHLVGRICSLWNGHEIIPYLESLLVDDREGKRAGFDLPVYRDILMLLGIAHELERLKSLDVEMQNVLVNSGRAASPAPKVDPVSEADFNIIEFETIDFPAIDLNKNTNNK